jgi:hypothetical protein
MSDKKYTSIKHQNAAGRVDFNGGKAVWHWTQDQNDSTSILIKSLDNPELELEKTQKTAIARPPDAKPKAELKVGAPKGPPRAPQSSDEDDDVWKVRSSGRGSGFDPYNRS